MKHCMCAKVLVHQYICHELALWKNSQSLTLSAVEMSQNLQNEKSATVKPLINEI